MTELWITVEPTLGCGVFKAIEDAIALAQRLGVGVNLPFNGIILRVTEESASVEVVSTYLRRSRPMTASGDR